LLYFEGLEEHIDFTRLDFILKTFAKFYFMLYFIQTNMISLIINDLIIITRISFRGFCWQKQLWSLRWSEVFFMWKFLLDV